MGYSCHVLFFSCLLSGKPFEGKFYMDAYFDFQNVTNVLFFGGWVLPDLFYNLFSQWLLCLQTVMYGKRCETHFDSKT